MRARARVRVQPERRGQPQGDGPLPAAWPVPPPTAPRAYPAPPQAPRAQVPPGTPTRTRKDRGGRLRTAFMIAFPLLLAWALLPGSGHQPRIVSAAQEITGARTTVNARPTTALKPPSSASTVRATPRASSTTAPATTASTIPTPTFPAQNLVTPTTSGSAATNVATLIAQDLFQRLNAERKARGLRELTLDPNLASMALDWSQHMAATGVFAHRDLASASGLPGIAKYSALGENIAWVEGFQSEALQLHKGWMQSDGHRANMLQPGFDAVGIGVVCADGRAWATEDFGRLDNSTAPPMTSAVPPQNPIVATRIDSLHC